MAVYDNQEGRELDSPGRIVGVDRGGAGASMAATGGTGHVVKQETLGGAFTTGLPDSDFVGDVGSVTGGANVLSAVKAFGDSQTVGVGASTPALSYAALVAAGKGWALTNAAASGSQIGDSGQIGAIFAEVVTTTSNYFALWGFNDERLFGVSNPAGLSAYTETLRAAIAWLTIPNANKVLASQAASSGTWISSGGALGSHFSSVNGSSKTFTLYGRTVYVWYVRRSVATGTLTITVDGVNYAGTINGYGQEEPDSGYEYAPTLYRITNLAEGVHTVVFTKTGGDTVYVIAAAAPTPAVAGISGPYLFAGNTVRATSAGYAANGGSDANTALYNSAMRDVVQELASDGCNVTHVDVAAIYDPVADGSGDGAHMGDAGHAKAASAFLAAMNSFAQPRDRRIAPLRPPIYIGDTPARSGTLNFANAATIGVRNSANTGDMLIRLDDGMKIDAVHRLATEWQNLAVRDTDAFAIDIGGAVGMGGKFDTAGTVYVQYAGIAGRKENATDGNVRGYLAFLTQAGSGIVEGARIDSNGVAAFSGSRKFVTTQFDKTSDTTLANVTGLSVLVRAGIKYAFEVIAYCSSNASGGVKFAIGGTATATSIIYEAALFSAGVSTAVGTARATALGTAVADITAVTAVRVVITGTIVVNAAGTLTLQMAQNASFGTASSVLVGSTFSVWGS